MPFVDKPRPHSLSDHLKFRGYSPVECGHHADCYVNLCICMPSNVIVVYFVCVTLGCWGGGGGGGGVATPLNPFPLDLPLIDRCHYTHRDHCYRMNTAMLHDRVDNVKLKFHKSLFSLPWHVYLNTGSRQSPS